MEGDKAGQQEGIKHSLDPWAGGRFLWRCAGISKEQAAGRRRGPELGRDGDHANRAKAFGSERKRDGASGNEGGRGGVGRLGVWQGMDLEMEEVQSGEKSAEVIGVWRLSARRAPTSRGG